MFQSPIKPSLPSYPIGLPRVVDQAGLQMSLRGQARTRSWRPETIANRPARFRITETVCGFERPRLIAWQKKFGTRWLLHAARQQHLEPVGESACSYHNTDRLTGVLAPMVFACFGGFMRRGFDDVAKGLKAYAEARQAEIETSG